MNFDLTFLGCLIIDRVVSKMKPVETSPKANAMTEAEVRSAFDGLVAYYGTYEVNENDGYIIHHLQMDRVPNVAGTDRKRYFTISGNRLVLRPSPLPDGIKHWTLEFERVTKK